VVALFLDFADLALTDAGAAVDPRTTLDRPPDNFGAGRARQLCQLVEMLVYLSERTSRQADANEVSSLCPGAGYKFELLLHARIISQSVLRAREIE
jgi:hypothetical protein